jgi:glycosyltransferase involved in cell wall biosynthesis
VDAIVVVPARDEAKRIGACLRALAAQRLPAGERFAVIVVLDDCHDATAEVAAAAAAAHGLALHPLAGPGRGAGAARRAGMELAAATLLAADRPHGLIASTDADTRPEPDWLARQLAHVRAGAHAIGGLIDLDPDELATLPDGVGARRAAQAALRLARLRASEPHAEHHHFAGASLAVRADVYRRVGGIDPLAALEDEAFAARLRAHGVSIARPADVRVRTSARAHGRSQRGLAVDLDVAAWCERRRYDAGDFDLATLAAAKGATTVSVIVPAKEVADAIAGVLGQTVGPLVRAGLVDELVVIDAGSTDGTAEVAAAVGARVLQQDELLAEHGPALGKGDAMWRALHATTGDVVCFLDADTADPTDAHLRGLLGPLLADPSLMLVKGAFARPWGSAADELPHEGGRVTELMARPLLNFHVPRLAGFEQPLAGEFAARRELLEAIPFPVGYGVEIAVLIDALRRHGLDALAESELGTRQNRHQPLRELSAMSYGVLVAASRRLLGAEAVDALAPGPYVLPGPAEVDVRQVAVEERPPLSRTRRSPGPSCAPGDPRRPSASSGAAARTHRA